MVEVCSDPCTALYGGPFSPPLASNSSAPQALLDSRADIESRNGDGYGTPLSNVPRRCLLAC